MLCSCCLPNILIVSCATLDTTPTVKSDEGRGTTANLSATLGNWLGVVVGRATRSSRFQPSIDFRNSHSSLRDLAYHEGGSITQWGHLNRDPCLYAQDNQQCGISYKGEDETS
ncbi:hypothetical protein BDV36DRAFT_181529 [Aspergillus pseudocaelatus]|uniref:Uncharacterized protein n=1 Tax=Aspergillus pseudocaelatus TaxID=1825620 RepID=A0ABQ6WJT5_9EURO|nr:hypothetical protein BDV36DRAFT_181529 [Aspergillus pseudocaelatus]